MERQVGEPTEGRGTAGKRAGLILLFCNLILFAAKLTAGLLSGSVSVRADAVNNLSDASSGVITLLGFRMASRPADSDHPYGHGRYEYLSALVVAMVISVIGFELLRDSVDKVIHPALPEFGILTVVVLGASICIKAGLALYNLRQGRRIGSPVLLAAAVDSRNDVITTAVVLAATVVSHYTAWAWLDGAAGIPVALFILYSGVRLLRDTVSPLLGRAPDRETVNALHEMIMSREEVLGTHDLMVHDYGPDRRFASVHVEMAAEGDALHNHEIIDSLERECRARFGIHLVIHLDPVPTLPDAGEDGAEAETAGFRGFLEQAVRQIHPALTVHDLRLVRGSAHTNAIFDCMVPPEVVLTDRQITEQIAALVRDAYPSYYCTITVDRGYLPVQN